MIGFTCAEGADKVASVIESGVPSGEALAAEAGEEASAEGCRVGHPDPLFEFERFCGERGALDVGGGLGTDVRRGELLAAGAPGVVLRRVVVTGRREAIRQGAARVRGGCHRGR